MEVHTESLPNGDSNGVHSTDSTDSILLLEHIARLIETNLGAARRELEAVGNLLSQSKQADSLARCGRFASEPQATLFAQKDLRTEDQVNGYDTPTEIEHTYSLSEEFTERPTTVASIAFLKRPPVLDVRKPIPGQLYSINLPGPASENESDDSQTVPSSAFEVMHTILHTTLTPYFDAHTKTQDPTGRSYYDADVKTGVPGAKRRFQELENALRNLQQNTDIPIIHLPMHELVEMAIEQAREEGVEPSLQHLPANIVDNTTVLNSLTNHLNGWIKTIQQVTRLVDESECGS